jgi:hypothetical protein
MNRIYKKDPTLVEQVGEMMKINGRGNPCKCADSKLMIEILWAIPDNDTTRAYRRQCADIIDRYQRGDPTLVGEIARNNAAAAANGGVPEFKAVPVVPTVDLETDAQMNLAERKMALRERERIFDFDVAHPSNTLEKMNRDITHARASALKASLESFQMARDFLESINMLDSRQLVDIGVAINVQVRQAGIATGTERLPLPRAVTDAPGETEILPRVRQTPREVTTSKIEAQLMKPELGWSTRFITEHECAIGVAVSKAFKAKHIKAPEKHTQYDKSNETRLVNHYTTDDRELFKDAMRVWYSEHTDGVQSGSITCQACGVTKTSAKSGKKQKSRE